MSDIVNSGDYELRSDALREELSSRYGSDVELMNLKHGIFDEACISVIPSAQCIASSANQAGTLTFALESLFRESTGR